VKSLILKSFFISTGFILICLFTFFPGVTNALTQLDEDEMVELSPARIETIKEKEKSLPPIPKNEFENSICFKRCHQPSDFSPSHKTRKQWLLLIEKEGHAIFEKIPWQSSEHKDRVLIFLLRHAKDESSVKEGIGVWD